MKRRISIAIAGIMLAMQFCQPVCAYAKTTAETDQTTTSDNMVQENIPNVLAGERIILYGEK